MENHVIFISINLLTAICGILTFTTLYIQKNKNEINTWSLAYGTMIISLLIAMTFSSLDLKVLLLLLMIGFSINQIIALVTLKLSVLIFIQFSVHASLFFIPFNKIPLPDQWFFDLEGLYFLLISIAILILYQKINKRNLRTKLSTPLFTISLAAIFIFLISPIYSLPILVLLLSITASYILKTVLDDNKQTENEMSLKIKRLERDFNDEVRKAVNKHTFHLKEVQEKMSQINKIDALTKAYNKKAIFNIIEDLAQDRRVPTFSLIMFDIDHFKTLNDTLGHVQGDFCLKTLSSIAFECIRDTDYLGRFGGDEFLIVLPKADIKTCQLIAERFRKKIASESSPYFTLSIGIANFPLDGNNLKTLLDVADKGLYISKESGRNKVSYHKT
jgi:diguanylate cyclase (GGDEF)-like protein